MEYLGTKFEIFSRFLFEENRQKIIILQFKFFARLYMFQLHSKQTVFLTKSKFSYKLLSQLLPNLLYDGVNYNIYKSKIILT